MSPSSHDSSPVLAELAASRLIGVPDPLVTVVIPVFNKWEVTRRCLASLLRCDVTVPLQLVVVDDGSSDDTVGKLALLPGIDVVRNGVNAGFVHSCKRGAKIARGDYLLFLNNDTEVAPGALETLVARAQSDPRIGIVGSKLVYPDGRLQEAGGIVFSDASGWNYGRLDDPLKPEYNFVRDVDYVSGASLLISATLFADLGGFDERFAPAYYEDTDLCFSARARGLRVVYEPRSVVTHYEGVTSGTSVLSGVKRYQESNKLLFREKWRVTLERDHEAPDARNVHRAARRRIPRSRSVLMIDSYVPVYDKESGSNRLRHLIEGLLAAGERVVLLPDNLEPLEPYTSELQSHGVEVLYFTDGDPRRCSEWLLEALPSVDAVWICRPELCRKYLPQIRAASGVPIVYDTIDLHHVRMRRQAELEGHDDGAWRRVEQLELACARAADGTVVVSGAEAGVLRAAGITDVTVVSNVHDPEPPPERGYASTDGILFIGGYNHTPNVDAVEWLVHDIMPLVWAQHPAMSVTLLGANPPDAVKRLASDRVHVTGYVRDVEPHFRRARLFVAPLRYGAGIKGKIGQALAYRLPTVTTSVGAEGFGLIDGVDALIADDAAAFAGAILALYRDPVLWSEIAETAPRVLEPFAARRVVAAAVDMLDRLGARRLPVSIS